MARPQQPYLLEIGQTVKTKYSNFVIEKQMRVKRESSDIRDNEANYISKCLQECNFYGLCDYNPKEARRAGARKSTNGKPIICVSTNETFNSAAECSKNSIEKFGVFLKESGITRVCRNERSHYKGFKFKYIE